MSWSKCWLCQDWFLYKLINEGNYRLFWPPHCLNRNFLVVLAAGYRPDSTIGPVVSVLQSTVCDEPELKTNRTELKRSRIGSHSDDHDLFENTLQWRLRGTHLHWSFKRFTRQWEWGKRKEIMRKRTLSCSNMWVISFCLVWSDLCVCALRCEMWPRWHFKFRSWVYREAKPTHSLHLGGLSADTPCRAVISEKRRAGEGKNLHPEGFPV